MFKTIIIVIMLCMLCGCFQKNNNEATHQNLHAAALCNVQLGLGYLQSDQIPRAKEKLLIALKQAPKSAEAQLAMGYFLLHTHEPELAEKYYREAMKLAPHDGRIQNNYGAYLYQTGQYRLAIALFVLAAKNPVYLNSSLAYQNAGLCALKLHRKALARQYLGKAAQGLSGQHDMKYNGNATGNA